MSTTTEINMCEYDKPVEYTIEVINIKNYYKKIVFVLKKFHIYEYFRMKQHHGNISGLGAMNIKMCMF